MMKRIVVEPPQSETRRDRVERKLFEQLAAVRVVERAESVIPPDRRPQQTTWLVAGAGLAAAAAIVLIIVVSGDRQAASPLGAGLPSPSRVVTPIGGTSLVTLPGALIEAQSDTSVEVQHGAGGAITLVIARGAVECDVEHKPGRPPFRVIAGDLSVDVVGTRFTVARTPSPRVDVARGKVKVTAPGGQWLVEAGEAWPDATRTAARVEPQSDPPPSAPATTQPDEAPAGDVSPAGAPPKQGPAERAPVRTPKRLGHDTTPNTDSKRPPAAARERARESYKIANKLASTDPRKAAQLYRAIATEGNGMEAVALVSLAEVELKLGAPGSALAALDELAKRFPGSANAEDAAWFRYEALRAMGKRDEARGAAADYLRQFPSGAYADRLQQTR